MKRESKRPDMTEKFAGEDRPRLTTPELFLSSEEMGWDALTARAFHEPIEFEGLLTPTSTLPYVPLVLLTGGTMHIEHKPATGPWQGGVVRPEELILMTGGNEPGELRWKGLSTEPMQTLHLYLNKDVLAQTAEELAYDPARLFLVERLGFQDPLLTQIGLTLWRELEQRTATGKLYAQTAAQMLAVHLLRHYTSESAIIQEEPSQKLTRQQIKRVTDFVLAYLNQDLSLEALAQQTGFSSYYFARLFRQTMGESPHQFVLRQRVEKAQKLLKETGFSLAHIALESGFANQSHFTRIFKRQLGITPRAYRQCN